MPDEAQLAPENETTDTPADVIEASDQETPSESQDSTPAASDYEGRYNNLRSEFDRRNALLTAAEGNQGPEAQAQALRQLGVEVALEEEQEPDDEWIDPDDRLDALEQKLAQKEEAEQEANFQKLEDDFIEKTLSSIESSEGVKLSKEENEFVVNSACMNRLDNGEPNLKGAYDNLKGIKSAARNEYLSSKRNAPKAPVGTAGEDKVDFSKMTEEQKRDWMVQDLESRSEES